LSSDRLCSPPNQQSGVTVTSIQSITLTASTPVTSTDQSAASNNSSGGLSTGAKAGIGAGVGGGAAALILAGLAFWWFRRRKQRVGDDFKWPDLGMADGTGSGGTTAGLYPNPTHPTGNNRFDMDDDELFDGGDGTTAVGSGSKVMSERDPSFLSSAAGSAGGYGAGAGAGYPGGAGAGAATAGAAGLAGFGAAGAVAAPQAHRPQNSNGGAYNNDGSDYGYGSQDGHHQSPPGSQYSHGNQQGAYGGYNNSSGYEPYYGTAPAAGGAAAMGAGAGAASANLGRTGSIASTAARNYQVEAIPGSEENMYNDGESQMDPDEYNDRRQQQNPGQYYQGQGGYGQQQQPQQGT